MAVFTVACAGPFNVSSAVSPATPNAPPFVGSAFTRCTVFVTDSGLPGRPLQQQEFQVSPAVIGPCPQYLVLTNPSNSPRPASVDSQSVFHLSSISQGRCAYVSLSSPSDNIVGCTLAPTSGAVVVTTPTTP